MKDTELRQERDRSVYETYLRGLRTQTFTTVREAADWVRSQPAPQYFISGRMAAYYISKLQQGKDLGKVHPNTRQKVLDLYANYLRYREEHPDCRRGRQYICELLVEEEAPCYYINYEYTCMIINRMRAQHQKQLQKRYRR